MLGGGYHKMPLYRFIKLMLVSPVDLCSGRELHGCNLIAGVCVRFVLVMMFFCDMDHWNQR